MNTVRTMPRMTITKAKPNLGVRLEWAEKKSIKIGAIALAIVLSVLYVVQINMTATKGYEIRELEGKLSLLQHESHALRLQSLELQSMERLQTQLAEDGAQLIAARPEAFISLTSTAVASAQ